MSDRTTPPFRADHVGSLLRPQKLLQAREDFADDRIDADELREIEDEAIRDVVPLQEDVGLQSATDGEFRRASWHMDFIYQLGGISKSPGNLTREVPQRRRRHRVHARGDAHRRQGHAGAADLRRRDFEFLQSVVTDATPKLTIPSPSMVHYRGGRAAIEQSRLPRHGRVLGRPDDRLRRPGAGDRRARLHLPAVRRHEPRLPQRPQPARRDGGQGRRRRAPARELHPPHQRGARRSAPTAWRSPPTCAAATSARAGSPRAATTSSPRRCSTSSHVDGFFMEWDDARSGGFEPLRFVPKGKIVVLGLVTTKTRRARDQGLPQAPDRGGDPSTSTSTSSASRRSAASPRPSRATRSASSRRPPSCG